MTAQSPSGNPAEAAAARPKCVIYVGRENPLVAAALAPLGGTVTLRHEPQVAAALVAAAQTRAHAVIVDLTEPDDGRMLLVAALAGAKHPPRVIVVGQREEISGLLRLPGVYSVITWPLLPAQIRAAITDRRAQPRNGAAPEEPPGPPPRATLMQDTPLRDIDGSGHAMTGGETVPTRVTAELASSEARARQRAWPGVRLYMLAANRFMGLISTAYKNTAFVLLACLFAAFCFYGFLIAYFLLASAWGAPMTLTRGHEMVERAVGELSDARTALTATSQRLNEAELEARTAQSAYDDAATLVDFMKGTIATEIDVRGRQSAIAARQADRLRKVLADFRRQEKAATRSSPKALFDKRLITKKSYDAQSLGGLEADQRLSQMEGELDAILGDLDRLISSITFLQSLKLQMEGGKAMDAASGSAELMLLTKQSVDARSALDQAESQLKSAGERQALLRDNAAMLRTRIAEIEASALGRAVNSRIDVIFVPYGNERSFRPGVPLYTCALTVIVCHRAGVVGEKLPGESTAIHPFFGKPLRGYFVEAKLSDPDAASEEIIHAGRPPFFF